MSVIIEQRPLGAIVPLTVEPNFAGWYELASIANRYGSRLRIIAAVNIDHPDITEPQLDSGIDMLVTAGVKVVGMLYLSKELHQSRQLMMRYKKHYSKLSGVCLIDPTDNRDRTEEIAHLAGLAKIIGFELVIAVVNVMDSGRNDLNWLEEVRIGRRYLSARLKSHYIDIIMYYFFKELPRAIQMLKSEHYPSEKFAIAVTRQRIANAEAFRLMVRNVVSRFDVARYIYVEGGRDTTNNYMPYFHQLSDYFEITLQELEKISVAEERLNTPPRTKKNKSRKLAEEKKRVMVERPVDQFGIKKMHHTVDYRNPNADKSKQKLILIPNDISYDEVNESILRGSSAITYQLGKLKRMRNVEWTAYIKSVGFDTKRVRLSPEAPMCQFAIDIGDKTGYYVSITYGGFLRIGKTVDGISGRYRPGSGTNFPITNWLGVKVCLHQYPAPDTDEYRPITRIDVFLDEHAQDSHGSLVIANNQMDRWRSAYTTEDEGNWVFDREAHKKVKKKKDIRSSVALKTPIHGTIEAFTFRTAPGCRVDARFITMREIEPLRED